MKVKSYRELEVWQKSMELAEQVYHLSAMLPGDEKFGLSSQMRRCAVSVPSNIAEGAGRAGTGEFLQHLSFARGSLMELETQLTLSVRLKLVDRKTAVGVWECSSRVGQMLNKLMAALRRKR